MKQILIADDHEVVRTGLRAIIETRADWMVCAEAADGKEVFLAQKCNLCHAVSSAGIEATTTNEKLKGPDLSTVEMPDAATLAAYLKQEEMIEGKKHKKKFTGSDEELNALIAWLQKEAAAG